ncbi:VOC family protein [Chitinophaga sancti]|uniref:VOC family protein n=1 Tax=Chitinophaga sancti TaxID=1004 RepID=UPI002A763688|nr:VOC family protein [Chitinophaga sancti]WPQ63040.1 VOC family protein [Chitinophaga sancti]
MEPLRNALNWFEIPVHDFDRAKKFYSQILGCDLPEQTSGFKKMAFFPFDSSTGAGGALVHGTEYLPSQRGALIYLNAGEDLTPILDRVEAAGGKIELDKRPISDIPLPGFFAIIYDTDGNRIALHSRT